MIKAKKYFKSIRYLVSRIMGWFKLSNTLYLIPNTLKRPSSSRSYKKFAAVSVAITIILSLVAFVPGLKIPHAQAAWYNSSWNYRQKIIIDHNKVPNTDQTDFPVLIKITDTSNGIFTKAQDDGDDLLFTSSNETTKLSHEIETFSKSTHELWAWVKIPTLSHTTDTTIYLYYGNASATAPSAAEKQATWSNGFIDVQHLNDATTSTTTDSTSNGNNGVKTAANEPVEASGKIGRAQSFDGSNDNIRKTGFSGGTDSYTISAWVNPASVSAYRNIVSTDSNNPMLRVSDGASISTYAGGRTDSSSLSISSWQYVTWTHSASNEIIYKNGLGSSYASTGGTAAWTNTNIGCWNPGTQHWYGLVDEVKISSSVRSADWIATEYNNQNSPETFATISGEVGKDNYTIPTAPAGWYDMAWGSRQPITFDHTKVPNTNQTDFPALVKITDVSNDIWAKAQADGDDILFADTSGNKLAHEIEKYDSATHELWAWVKIPSLLTASDTSIYMYYGNSGSANQQSATSVWSNGYSAVYHMGEASGTIYDSTINGNNGTQSGGVTFGASGKTGYATNYDGANDYVGATISQAKTTTDYWYKSTSGSWTHIVNSNGTVYVNGALGSLNDYPVAIDGTTINIGKTWKAHQYWRFLQTAVYDSYAHSPRTCELRWIDTSDATRAPINYIYGGIFSYSGDLWNTSFDELTNTSDSGWISGNTGWINAEYIAPGYAMKSFGAYSSYPGGGRGGVWSIQWSDNNSDWTTAKSWNYETTSNGGGLGVGNYAGWYNTSLNPTEYVDGSIDEARVSSSARSADWIATEYANQNDPATFETFGAAETADTFAPTNPSSVTGYQSSGGALITNNAGSDSTPYYSWPEPEATGGATDQTGAYVSGVAGYYSYFGTSCGVGGGDPALSRGVLADTGSGLHYSSDVNISVPDLTTNEDSYCLRIKTKDNAGNISSVLEVATYIFDLTAPNAPTFIAANPAGYSSTDSFDFTWPVATDVAGDGSSGIQGYQYMRGGTSGDVWSATQTETTKTAITSYQTGANIFLVRSVDNAGNTSAQVQTTYYYSNTAPTKPTALTATPEISDTNSFSFSWTAPVHARPIVDYGYSINAVPTTGNLTWTGSATASLAADSFATAQGVNTLYLVAKDDSGAYALDAANYASVAFNCQTSAPPIPASISISDSSNRAYSTYSLTIKWSAGSGQNLLTFDHYSIERSTDNVTFAELATTTSTAYIDVSSLSNSTTYYYRIKSVDNAGSTSAASTTVSRIPTGKYDTAPTILQGPSETNVKATEATITWVTNRASTGAVRFGTSAADLSRSQIDPTEETEHSITIPGLEGGTNYYYQVQSLDNDRDYSSDSAYSATANFTTLALPAISDVKISNITLNSADLSWTTSTASNATLSYGKSISYGSTWSDSESYTTNHTYKLEDLEHTSTYHFKITGTDEDGNQIISDDYVFDTLPMPKISSVNFESDLKGTEPKSYITWTTNVATTSSVDYQPKTGSATYEESQSSFVTSHKVELSHLSDDTSYSFYVYGTDQFGNIAKSDEYSFATPFDSRAAVISDILTETSNVGLNKQDKAQMVISWSTDEPTTSQVEYSEGLAGDQYKQKTSEDHNLTTNHLIIISDLKPNTPYHFRVVSHDKGANLSESPDQSIIAGEVPGSIFKIIMNTFENVFGWLGKLI